MSNRLIGFSDIISGCVGILVQLGLLGTRTKLVAMYASLELRLPPITTIFPYLVILVMCYCVFVIYLGVKLLGSKGKDKKLLKRGVFNLIFIVPLLGVFSLVSAVSLIFPLYNATNYL